MIRDCFTPWLIPAAMALSAHAAELDFVCHDVDPDSQFSACAALDVNKDGRLDIVSGGWWYEAPDWKRHFLRDVEMIRGRYDDYSALPIDANADGRLDLVSVNYRSQSLYWVEQPESPADPWRKHVIDTPGPMETGRLADVDGDGRLDVLPNGVGFAAWWEWQPGETSAASDVIWVRHDLAPEIAGHGVGFGDLNGDGRGDIVGPTGWLEAPPNRRAEPWRFHAEFRLDRDASVPILVADVDDDGDNDLIWGRGHRVGLYWLEQRADEGGNRSWIRHAIDTSWSQAHSLLLADLDGDGRDELVTGKRYLGHEGKDLGEYDPLGIYRYDFDVARRVWTRGVISQGGRAGFDLDPKAVDLDADGDIDLIAPGRSGLYWLENRGGSATTEAQAPGELPATGYHDHTQVLVYRDDSGQPQPVRTAAEWALRRQHILVGLETVMGRLPDPSQRVPLDVETLGEEDRGEYIRRRIAYQAEAGDRVPAYLLLPKGAAKPRPAVLCLHQTTDIGKDEPAGLGGRATLHYAHELAQRGYVCIVPDYPGFGAYRYELATPPSHYASGSMKAIWNNVRAVDVLEALPEVDHDRIGCIGHSLGGHNALFTAAFDQRIRAVVTSCGFTAMHDYYGGDLTGWSSRTYMPRIREIYHNDPNELPFDFHEVLAAIAPRSIFVNAPQRDDNFDVGGVHKVVAEARRAFGVTGAPEGLVAVYPDCAHDFPDDVRRQTYEWLDGRLR